jgi:hypothetical protein
MQSVSVDAAGHRPSPVTMPGFHEGRAPRNKGRRYPADPPTVEEIIAVMRRAGSRPDGKRLRALIVIVWRAGLRVDEALDVTETDLRMVLPLEEQNPRPDTAPSIQALNVPQSRIAEKARARPRACAHDDVVSCWRG